MIPLVLSLTIPSVLVFGLHLRFVGDFPWQAWGLVFMTMAVGWFGIQVVDAVISSHATASNRWTRSVAWCSNFPDPNDPSTAFWVICAMEIVLVGVGFFTGHLVYSAG